MRAVDLWRCIGHRGALSRPFADTPGASRAYGTEIAVRWHRRAGTCRMGTDAAAFVDPRLRVHGIDGLLVADASVVPMLMTGNTNAPSIMIDAREAERVLGDA